MLLSLSRPRALRERARHDVMRKSETRGNRAKVDASRGGEGIHHRNCDTEKEGRSISLGDGEKKESVGGS